MQVLQVVFGDRISRATVCVLSLTIARVAGVIVGEGGGGGGNERRRRGTGTLSPVPPFFPRFFSLPVSIASVLMGLTLSRHTV